MARKNKDSSCCGPVDTALSSCRVDSLISIDERGQMVLPKELRDKAGIRPGDKLAVTSWERNGKVCCISLIKVEELTEMVKGVLGPVMKEIF